MEKSTCFVQCLGRVPFQDAWTYQKRLAEDLAEGMCEDTLLLLEHPHTFTFGRLGQPENLLWSKEEISRKGITVVWTDRGGDVTYHGPGQVVGYPLIRLVPIGGEGDRIPQADYVGYIRKLEEVLIRTLADYHLAGFRVAGKSGVWVQPEEQAGPMKVASIGVKVDVQGVTQHGFSLNVDPDMHYWAGIIPCGLSQVEMTAMDPWISDQVDCRTVMAVIAHHFGSVFERAIVWEVPPVALAQDEQANRHLPGDRTESF